MTDSEKPKSWKECRQSIQHKWLVPLIFLEWLCERFSSILERWAFLNILGHAGRLTILIGVILYFMEADERAITRHNQAWQVIALASGKSGNLGRRRTLRLFVKDNIPLAGIDLSKAHLPGQDLHSTNLEGANLSGAYLVNADLSKANLSKANLSGANLSGARLYEANLSGANLYGSSIMYVSKIDRANIHGTENTSDKFIEWALENGAVSIESNEDWEKYKRENLNSDRPF